MSNINLIRERLAKLQGKGSSEKVDYSAIFWKPKLGKQVVRIVPRKANKDFPFAEVSLHEYRVFKRTVYSLENFGEKDPVVQLVKELYNDNTEDSKELAKKIRPRTKYFAQVVVRGEEDAGVRIWEFNKTTYEKLLTIMADDDFGEIDDITQGTDLTIEGYNDSILIGKKEVKYIAVNVTPKRNASPLSKDPEQVKEWLENQKDILEIHKKYSYDEIKEMLKKHLSPESEEDDSESGAEAEEVTTDDMSDKIPGRSDIMDEVSKKKRVIEDDEDEQEEAPKEPVGKKKPAPASKSDKFKDLFGDED